MFIKFSGIWLNDDYIGAIWPYFNSHPDKLGNDYYIAIRFSDNLAASPVGEIPDLYESYKSGKERNERLVNILKELKWGATGDEL
jgi:hypothetical protein